MSDTSTILSLPYLQPAQAQKHVTHNEGLRQLDLLVQLAVIARDKAEPPAAPEDGARHIVGVGGTDAWAGHDDEIAVFTALEGWLFVAPLPGWRAWVLEEAQLVVWDGTGWSSAAGQEEVAQLGINTAADTTNRLAVAAPATLLTHNGAGHQVKINKSAETETASLLFQTGWSGRAEMGTNGSDGFAIKVSADGSGWTTALVIDPVTGLPSLPEGAQINARVSGNAVTQGQTDATEGRLLKVGDYGLGSHAPSVGDASVTDNSLAPGLYAYATAGGSSGGPPDVSRGLLIHGRRNANGGESQLLVVELANPVGVITSGEILSRSRTAGAWSPWLRSYGAHNLLGTVGLSGGTPTGAVIEQGSGAGGRYVRFADGTQICEVETPGQASDTAVGALFQAGSDGVWSFPIAFDAPPVVTGQIAGGPGWVAVSDSGTATAQYCRHSALPETISVPLRLMAVGRWT